MFIFVPQKPPNMKKTLLLILFMAFVGFKGWAQVGPPPLCWSPINLNVSNVTTYGATFSWTEVDGATSWEVLIQPAGMPLPMDNSVTTALCNATTFTFAGLTCATAYDFYVRVELASCTSIAPWSQAVTFTTMGCNGGGTPQDLTLCAAGGLSCFDLTVNDAPALGNLNPLDYTVSYHDNLADAANNTAAFTGPVCLQAPLTQVVFVRVTQNQGPEYHITAFTLSTQSTSCPGIRMQAFVDSNGNGSRDGNEPPFLFGSFRYERNGDGNVLAASGGNGQFTFYDSDASSSYNLSYVVDTVYAPYYTATPAQFNNVQPPASGIADYAFPVTVSTPFQDVGVAIASTSPPRPGFVYAVLVAYTNHGSQAASGTIDFENLGGYPFNALDNSFVLTPTGFSAPFANLQPGETRSFYVQRTMPVIPNIALGDLVTTSVAVIVADDVMPSNNQATLSEIVVGSYDPNDKMEAHGPEINIDDFTAGDALTYTIRFENTGTAAAETVLITDVLDAQLVGASARLISSSHPCSMLRNGQSLSWHFNDIQLQPVSETDPLQGHGYITFAVNTTAGVGLGDVIPNTASIYFDFNPAIVTNTFETRIVETLGVKQARANGFVVFPNPAQDVVTIQTASIQKLHVSVLDLSGKVLMQTSDVTAQKQLDVSGLASGMYVLKLVSGAQTSVQKLLVR